MSYWKMNSNKASVKAAVYTLCEESVLFSNLLFFLFGTQKIIIAVQRFMLGNCVTELFATGLKLFPKEFTPLRTFTKKITATPKGRSPAVASQEAWQSYGAGSKEDEGEVKPIKKWNAKKVFSKEEQKAELDADELIDYEDIEDV